jgi:hypothetical protein
MTGPKANAPPESWDRWPGESAPAHGALQTYLTLGEKRSIQAVAEAVGKNASLIEKWSAAWKWTDRATAYDTHTAAVEQASRDRQLALRIATWERRREEQAEEDYSLAVALRKQAKEMLAVPLEDASWTKATAVSAAKASAELASYVIGRMLEHDDPFDPLTATAEESREYLARLKERNKVIRQAKDE